MEADEDLYWRLLTRFDLDDELVQLIRSYKSMRSGEEFSLLRQIAELALKPLLGTVQEIDRLIEDIAASIVLFFISRLGSYRARTGEGVSSSSQHLSTDTLIG